MSNWFKNKFTWIPMIIAIFVGLTFVFSLIPSFSKMPDGIKNMRVAVVNQDNNQISTTVARKLKQNLPFKITDVDNSVTKAKSQVRKDNLSVVVVIPKGFAKKAESNQKPQLNYIENSSVGTLESNTGTSVATRVNTMVQQQLQSKALIGMLAKQMAASANHSNATTTTNNTAAKAQQAQIAKQATAAANKLTVNLGSSTQKIGVDHSNMRYTMAPMFMTMGQYLGILIATIILSMAFMSIRFKVGNKFLAFLGLQISGVVMSLLVSLCVALATMSLIHVESFGAIFVGMWLFDLAVFEFTSSISLLFAGLPSIIIQLPLFAMQIVAGGAVLPRFAMPKFYQWLSANSPMYQGVKTIAHHLHGMGSIGAYTSSLWWIVVVGLVAGLIIVAVGYRGKTARGLSRVIPA